jgi:hypothetical protein
LFFARLRMRDRVRFFVLLAAGRKGPPALPPKPDTNDQRVCCPSRSIDIDGQLRIGQMRIRDYSGAGGSGQLRSGRQTARFPQLAEVRGKIGKMLEGGKIGADFVPSKGRNQ